MIAKEIPYGFGVKSTRLSDGSDDMEATILLKAPAVCASWQRMLPTLRRRAIPAYCLLLPFEGLDGRKVASKEVQKHSVKLVGTIEVGEVASAQNY